VQRFERVHVHESCVVKHGRTSRNNVVLRKDRTRSNEPIAESASDPLLWRTSVTTSEFTLLHFVWLTRVSAIIIHLHLYHIACAIRPINIIITLSHCLHKLFETCQCAANVLSPFMIFAVFDVLLAVNMCINYSFLHFYLQFYYCKTYLKFKKQVTLLALDGVYLTKKK